MAGMRLNPTMNLERALGGLDAAIARAEDLHRPLNRFATYHVRRTARILASGGLGIQSRTRELERSITYAFRGPNQFVEGSNVPHARSQQFGPTGGFFESSRPGGFLAIPIGDNVGARGRAKYLSPRDVPGGFFIRSKKGNVLMVSEFVEGAAARLDNRKLVRQTRTGKLARTTRKLRVWFVLKERVPGTAFRYARIDRFDVRTWDEYARDWIVDGRA